MFRAMARLGYTQDEPAALKDYQAYLTAISNLLSFADAPDLRAKIVQRLVQKVEVLPESFRIHFYVGKSGFVQMDPNPGGPSGSPGGSKSNKKEKRGSPLPVAPEQTAPNFILDSGSNSLTRFRGGGI